MSEVLATIVVDIDLTKIDSFSLAKELIDRELEKKSLSFLSKKRLIFFLKLLGFTIKEENENLIIFLKNNPS